MTDDAFGFAPPPFKPDEALTQLKGTLRDLKLSERAGAQTSAFELRGKRVLELGVDGALIQVRIARKLALTPEFDKHNIASAADQRKLVDELKKRLARWEREE
jgi:DNA-binding CsgD family transcriptional regulator